MNLPLLIELSLLGSLLTLAVLVLRGLGGRWLPAGIFCLAWLLVGLRLLAPLTPGSPMSLLNLGPWLENRVGEAASPPVPAESASTATFEAASADWVLLGMVPGFSAAAEAAPTAWRPTPWLVAGLLWLGGFAGLAGFAVFGQWAFRRGLRQDDDTPDPSQDVPDSRTNNRKARTRTRELREQAAKAAGLRRPLPLRFSAVGTGPCLSGVFRPVIVMPTGLAGTLDDRDLRLIFQHEMTHARRRDHWLHALLGLAACCHWFNPLAWWARRACRQDCELATDAALTRHADPTDRRAYGELLLKIARQSSPASSFIPQPSSLFFTLPMASPAKQLLKHRITMLHRPTKTHPLTRLGGLLLLGLAVLAAGTSAVEPKTGETDQAGPQGKVERTSTAANPGQNLYQTDLVVAEVEDVDALMKLLEKAGGLSIWDDFAPIQEALEKVDAEILSAPRLISEVGKRATISVADAYQERNDSGAFSHLKTGLVADITVLPGDTAKIPTAFNGTPTVFLDGHTTAGERIRVDANGDLLPRQPGDQTISIRIDDPMPHPLGKVGIFGGIDSWSQTERISLDPGADTISLAEAIAAAGGMPGAADTGQVTIRRAMGEAFSVDLRKILEGEADRVHLRDGDTVYVRARLF